MDSSQSKSELLKFGLSEPQSDFHTTLGDSGDHSTTMLRFGSFPIRIHPDTRQTDSVRFGNFRPVSITGINDRQSTFMGPNFQRTYWDSIPEFILWRVLDFRQVGYDDLKIAKTWSLTSVPPSSFIFGKLKICEHYQLRVQNEEVCECRQFQAQHAGNISHGPAHATETLSTDGSGYLFCNSLEHIMILCPSKFLCSTSGFLGHTKEGCGTANAGYYFWFTKSGTSLDIEDHTRAENGQVHINLVGNPITSTIMDPIPLDTTKKTLP